MTHTRRRVLRVLAASLGSIQGFSGIVGSRPDRIRNGGQLVQVQQQEFEQVAREGAQRGVEEFQRRGIQLNQQQAEAAIEGTVEGIGSQPADGVDATQIDAIATGSATGAITPISTYTDQISPDQILWATFGSAGSSVAAVSHSTQEGRQLVPEFVTANAFGAAEGPISEAGSILQEHGTSIDPAYVHGAALGAGMGVNIPASQESSQEIIYAATVGAGSGTTQGAYRQETQEQQVQLDLTSGAGGGAASGAIEGASQRPDATINLVYEAAYGAAIDTISQSQMSDFGQIFQSAFQAAADALVSTSTPEPPEETPIGEPAPPEGLASRTTVEPKNG